MSSIKALNHVDCKDCRAYVHVGAVAKTSRHERSHPNTRQLVGRAHSASSTLSGRFPGRARDDMLNVVVDMSQAWATTLVNLTKRGLAWSMPGHWVLQEPGAVLLLPQEETSSSTRLGHFCLSRIALASCSHVRGLKNVAVRFPKLTNCTPAVVASWLVCLARRAALQSPQDCFRGFGRMEPS